MSENRATSFLGLPIVGEYQQYTEGFVRPQRPLPELAQYLKPLLADPKVEKFGWIQYTPYFNDGEPCVFHVYVTWVKPVGGETEDDDEFYYDYEVRPYAYGDQDVSPKHHLEFSEAIKDGHFYQALLNTFGDPASVVFDKTTGQITIEFYDHE